MKTDEEIKDLYFDDLYYGLPPHLQKEYKARYDQMFVACVSGTFGFARFRLNIKWQELIKTIKNELLIIIRRPK